MLARVWVTEPDVLLLDEPTNHLDLARISQLETWLNALPRDVPVVICSHDRAFLDAVTNRTLFLRPQNSQVFSLPYSLARAALDEVDASEERRFQKDMKTAQQLRRQAAKLNNIGINSGSDLLVVKTKQLKQRAERLEDAARPAHQERSAGAIKLANRGTHAKVLVTLDDAAVTTPDGTLAVQDRQALDPPGRPRRPARPQRRRQDAAGQHGQACHRRAGRRRRRGQGDAVAGAGLRRPGSVRPCRRRHAAWRASPDASRLGEQRARSLLAGAGVGIDMQASAIGSCLADRRRGWRMLVLRLTNPNFYLLDEPTNHLDIDGQEALEAELMEHEASCLLVSHDRSFVRAVGNRFWLIEKRRLVEVEGPDAFFADVAKRE